MRRRNKYIILFTLVAVALGGAMGRYAYSQGFNKKWREYIREEFAKRGVHLEFEKLTLDPVRGLVAREVTLFGDEKRTRRLAKIDHISLDVDYAGLLGKEMFLDSFDLKDAAMYFELEPGKKKGKRLTIQDFSARVFLTGDRIQIRRAEGLVNGIEVSLSGLLNNTGSSDTAGLPDEGAEAIPSGFRTEDLAKAVRWLDQLKFDPKSPPRLEIDIHGGDLAELQDLRGTVRFLGSDLRIGGYACDEVEGILEMGKGSAVLKRFSVVDSEGRFDANAEYRFGEAAVSFHAESDADLPKFFLEALDWHPLGEVVFYKPNISVDGEFFLRSPVDGWPPVRAVGKAACEKIMKGGKMFESAQTDFSIDTNRLYLRNTVFEYKTGGFSGAAISDEDGFRYRVNLTLDPRAFEPFCEQQSTHALLQRFEFNRESAFFAEVSGAGRDTDPVNWENDAEFQLRNFTFDGVEIRKFGGTLHLATGVQTYRDIEISLGGGEATADLVRIDRVNEITEIRNFRGNIDMGELMRCFDAEMAAEIRRWKFRELPVLEIDGIADTRAGRRTDLKVKIAASGGIDLTAGRGVFPIDNVAGEIHLLGEDLDMVVGGGLFGGNVNGSVRSEQRGGKKAVLGHLEFGEIGFGELVRLYSPEVESGGKLTGEVTFSDIGSDVGAFDIRGSAKMWGGDVFAIPCLRSMSGDVAKVLGDPDGDFGVAREASASFTMSDGVIRTDDFEAVTPAFRIRVGGLVDLLEDDVDLAAETDGRGLTGSRFFPRGGILIYKGAGTVDATEWKR